MTMYDLNSQDTMIEKMRSKQLPQDYHPTMYQDGFSPYEILQTARYSMREDQQEEQDEPLEVEVKSR